MPVWLTLAKQGSPPSTKKVCAEWLSGEDDVPQVDVTKVRPGSLTGPHPGVQSWRHDRLTPPRIGVEIFSAEENSTQDSHRCFGVLRGHGDLGGLCWGLVSDHSANDNRCACRFNHPTHGSSGNGPFRLSRNVGGHGHRLADLRLPVGPSAATRLRRSAVGSGSRAGKESGARHHRKGQTSSASRSYLTYSSEPSDSGDDFGLFQRRRMARLSINWEPGKQHSWRKPSNSGNRRRIRWSVEGDAAGGTSHRDLLNRSLSIILFSAAGVLLLPPHSPARQRKWRERSVWLHRSAVLHPLCLDFRASRGFTHLSHDTAHRVNAAGANSECQAPNDRGKLVPCNDPTFGWLGSTGCYYKADPTFAPPPGDIADQHPAGQPGAYYLVTCSAQNLSTGGGGILWLSSGTAGVDPVVPVPAVLAQQAVNQLAIPDLSISASPSTGADQLVGLPTWLWLEEGDWHSIAATAAVPGESVTATATPISVTWSLGDGTTIVCQGPGTRYTAADPPNAPSPTCGHTYTTSSAGRPDNAFTVTATVSWTVAWAGGGQTGTVPDLNNTATTALRVADVEALNTANKEA